MMNELFLIKIYSFDFVYKKIFKVQKIKGFFLKKKKLRSHYIYYKQSKELIIY